jgi:hypothetical protein
MDGCRLGGQPPMSPRPERRADEGENVVMTISAQALATRWQAQYASGDHSGIADTFKLGTGGSLTVHRNNQVTKHALLGTKNQEGTRRCDH